MLSGKNPKTKPLHYIDPLFDKHSSKNSDSTYNLYMRCPECDLEQHDNAALCSGCGLSFAMWRQHNPPAKKAAPDPPKEMTFPVPEEKSAPQDKAATTDPPMESPSTEVPIHNFKLEGDPGESKGFQWKPFYWAGLGLILGLILGSFYFVHQASNPPSGDEKPVPLAMVTPGTSSFPGMSTPATSTPTNETTPEETPFDSQANPAAGTNNNSTSDQAPTPIPTEEPAPTSTPVPVAPANTPGQSAAAPAAPVDSSTTPAAAAAPDTPADSATVTSPASPNNPGEGSGSPAPNNPVSAAPAPASSPDLLESSQPLPTPTAIPVP